MTDYSARRVTMVDTQVRPSDVTKFPIIAAMLSVPRENYVPPQKREAAYLGGNLPIGPAREVVEARTLAKMLDALDIQPTDRILHLACALGYGTAVMAEICEQVVAIDEDAAFVEAATSQLLVDGHSNAVARQGALDAGGYGTFNVIVIEGGVQQIGAAVTAQLAEGGRIAAIFMDGALGAVRIGNKSSGTISWRFAFNATAPILSPFAAPVAFTL